MEDSRKRKLHAEASLAEIELSKAQELIISVDDHGEVIGKIGDLVKGRLMGIPSKTAPAVALEEKQTVCKQIIEDEIRECLSELARLISDDRSRQGKGGRGKKETGETVSATPETKRKRVGRQRKGTVV